MASNISEDLIWTITRGHSSTLCKRKQAGGHEFSRDPLNLVNKHSRKHEGYANDKAIGIQPAPEGGVTVMTKKANKTNKPGNCLHVRTTGPNTPTRRLYRGIVNSTAKAGYRPDLRAEAVARASAVRQAQRTKKERPTKKPRGAKAKKAAEVSA